MKRGFTISRFIARRSKNFCSIFFKLNGSVLIHWVDEDKTRNHNYYIQNDLKSVVKEISEQGQQVEKV